MKEKVWKKRSKRKRVEDKEWKRKYGREEWMRRSERERKEKR
jgi:hypothetical protein